MPTDWETPMPTDEAIAELLLALAGGEGLAIGARRGLACLPQDPAAPAKRPLWGQEDFDVSRALGMATTTMKMTK